MTPAPAASRMYIVTSAFGVVVAMWAVGYISHLPGVSVPGAVVLGPMLACLVAGALIAGRHAGAGPGGGALVGLVTGLVNLLILGSLLAGKGDGELLPSAIIWVPGSLLVSAALGALGAWIGGRIPGRHWDSAAWRCGFAGVAVVAGVLVIIAGGLVTSLDAGLAVPDWPNSFGSNMFLYPLAKMTGGIYYEHAHRLYGSLVGLTTVVLAVTLWRTETRWWLRGLGVAAVVMVIVQGVMGGVGVTGQMTLAADGGPVPPNDALRTVHGVFGQIFVATLGLIWAFMTPTWRAGTEAAPSRSAGTDHMLSGLLVAALLAQIALGAMYRHTTGDENPMPFSAMAHFTLALPVAIIAYLAGLRAWACYTDRPVLRPLGGALLVVLTLQLLLGVAALIPVMARRADWRTAEVILATAHQANGAIVLLLAVQLAAWTRRLLVPGAPVPEPTGGEEGRPGAVPCSTD